MNRSALRPRQDIPRPRTGGLPLIALLGALLLGTLVAATMPAVVSSVYLLLSGVTFVAYARDKAAAAAGRWRTPERSLHLLGLVGGWPGALVAQQVLRHKTGKRAFQVLFWLSVLINCGTLGWLASPEAAGFRSSLARVF